MERTPEQRREDYVRSIIGTRRRAAQHPNPSYPRFYFCLRGDGPSCGVTERLGTSYDVEGVTYAQTFCACGALIDARADLLPRSLQLHIENKQRIRPPRRGAAYAYFGQIGA